MQVARMTENLKKGELVMTEQEGVIELHGTSRWGDSKLLFSDLLNWTDHYNKFPKDTTVNVNLNYIDSSSAELLALFFKKLVKVRKKGYSLIVNWYVNVAAENSLTYGYVLSKVCKIRFNIIELN